MSHQQAFNSVNLLLQAAHDLWPDMPETTLMWIGPSGWGRNRWWKSKIMLRKKDGVIEAVLILNSRLSMQAASKVLYDDIVFVLTDWMMHHRKDLVAQLPHLPALINTQDSDYSEVLAARIRGKLNERYTLYLAEDSNRMAKKGRLLSFAA